ncbi:hypothetical protein JP75_06655 [Devosia riboflavina]|uniref:Uncharacterized protein n=1 Tax=Devosia riboflavina TaxID=46914 RepID=A0A087M4D7_9HYPH|nr:hypothetical protein [Devosia riboflavina]KFL31740.1 hypothetical protein JP75_06655 [Devosia riboflavina]
MPGIPKGTVALATILLGSTQIQQVRFGTTQIWANEVVVVLANTSNVTLKNLFTSVQWANVNLKKRVVVPVGVEVKATVNAFAILATVQADGLAGSWAGSLTLEVRGTVSGIGGAANSGVGGSVINVNFTGRNGEKLQLNLIGGTWRAGGGGGGRAGNGGQGLWYSARTVTEGPYYQLGAPAYYWYANTSTLQAQVWWNTTLVATTSSSTTAVASGGYTYYRSSASTSDGPETYYYIYRTYLVYDVPNYTAGGVAGNGGRGQGCDGAAAVGAAAAGGGTNAGASGKSGDGAAYGGTGQTGANGSTGNYTGGTAGAAGGLPGFYLTGAANSNFTNTGGTVLGRLAA